MIRVTTLLTALTMAAPLAAQEGDGPRLHQLELSTGGNGYAVVLDSDGNEFYCDAKETREAVDLGPCKPLRLVTPLAPRTIAPNFDTPTSVPSMSPAKRSVVELFERNRCAIDYADLKNVLERLGARQQRTIGETIAAMTDRGEIVDDAVRERAVLQIGDRCS